MKTFQFFLVLLLISYGNSQLFAQAPGSLDESFGDMGKVVITYENQSLNCFDAGYQSDGKIIIAGYKASHLPPFSNHVYALRLLQNGNVDNFGNMPNYFTWDLGSNSKGFTIHVLDDDKILIAGDVQNGTFLMRLTPDGELDYTFAGTNAYFFYDELYHVEDMLVVGSGSNTSVYLAGDANNHPAVLKTDEQGYVVNTFGDNGIMKIDISGSLYSLDRDITTGHIYGCGETGYDGLVIKFDMNGDLIPVFGDEGLVQVSPPSGGTILEPRTLIVDQLNNYITVFGDVFGANGGATGSDICSFRLNPNGSWNNTYGVNGWSYALINDDDHIHTAIRQTDGKFYFGGSTKYNNTESDFFLGRVKPEGFMDPVFGDNGYVVTEMEDYAWISSILLDEVNGTLLTAGNAYNLNSEEQPILVARYHTDYFVSIESHPNPADNIRVTMTQYGSTPKLKIITTTADNFSVRILNLAGKVIIPWQYCNGISEIPLEEPYGLYLVQIQMDDAILAKKVIVGM